MTWKDAIDALAAKDQRAAAAARIASAKADLLDLERDLDAATERANTYTDPDLNANGLQARRAEMVATARKAAGPALEQLLAQVDTAAETLASQAAAQLPKFGDDPASIAQSQRAWDKVRLRLDKGVPLRDVLANAGVEEALALREWGPAWSEAAAYRPPGLSESMSPTPAPDHGPLHRSIDARLAALAGPTVVASLAAAHEAAAVAAGVEVTGKYLANVIAGVNGTSALSSSVESHYAEQAARAGLAADNAPATEGVTAE